MHCIICSSIWGKNEIIFCSDSQHEMKSKDAFLLIFLGILLPTSDVYSDLAFAYRLYGDGHYRFAVAMISPVILSFVLLVFHWKRIEKTLWDRLISFPYLFFQIWPQRQVYKILKMGLRDKDPLWKQACDKMEREVSSLGMTDIQICYQVKNNDISKFQNLLLKLYLSFTFYW